MKKLLLFSLALGLLIGSCAKDPESIPPITPQPQPQPSNTIEAANATASDYVVGKKATVHGNISVDGTKSYFVFKDGTKILLYSPKSVFDALSADTKTKLKTNGQELTATGTFKDFTPKNSTTVIKQLVYESEDALKFGQGTTPQPNPNPNPNPSPSGIFDFEWIEKVNNSYTNHVTKTLNGVTLDATARTDTKEQNQDYAIQGKGLVLDGKRGDITITFPEGVKTISFDYKAFLAGNKKREILVSGGGIEDTISVGTDKQTYTKTLNKTGNVKITIKGNSGSKQFVIDNIKWTR